MKYMINSFTYRVFKSENGLNTTVDRNKRVRSCPLLRPKMATPLWRAGSPKIDSGPTIEK